MIRSTARVLVFALVGVGLVCAPRNAGPGTQLAPAPPRSEAISNPEVDAYIAGLRYDPRVLLAEQGEEVVSPRRLPEDVQDDGQAIVICRQAKHRLNGNIEDIVILDPIHGVVWPGALVRVDEDLVRGTPTPIQCRRAPASLSIDLPGIGGPGVFEVQDPRQGSVQAAIDSALDYWNDHQYREGYVSKSRSRYTSTFVHSAQQLAASLGISYRSLKGSLAAEFQTSSSRENTVGMVLFKQVFYTVSFDPPSHPGAVFHRTVGLDEVRDAFSGDEPPAYVSSVDYGRILMLRMETSTETLRAEMEAAMRVITVGVKAAADYQKALSKSKMTLITIGGNAEVNTRAVDATRIEDLNQIIRGRNALYSKGNPGQPISYTIRFLKDGRLARIGYSTDYTELLCERYRHGWIGVRNNGRTRAKLMMRWKEGNEERYWTSGELTHGKSARREMKGNSHGIVIKAQHLDLFKWHDVFSRTLEAPPNRIYIVNRTRWRESNE